MTKKSSKTSYRELKQQLESILEEFESDDIDVDSALKLYSEAQDVMSKMESYLKTASNSIKKLSV